MSSAETGWPRPSGRLLSRLLWPVAIMFVGALWVVFSTIRWSGDSANELAETAEQERLASTLTQIVGDTSVTVATAIHQAGGIPAAASGMAIGGWLERLATLLPSGEPFLVLPDGTVLAQRGREGSALLPLPTEAVAVPNAVAPNVAPLSEGRTGPVSTLAGRVVAVTGDLRIETRWASPPSMIEGRLRDGPVLVVWTRLDKMAVVGTMTRRGFEAFEVVSQRPSASFVPVPGGLNGASPLYLTWRSPRPGDVMRQRLMPLTALGICVAGLLFGAVALYLRAVTFDLDRSQTRARELLGRDPLSGLANRLFFNDTLDRELVSVEQAGRKMAVLFVDLDRFKDVNDSYGHQAGDHLIQLVAQRLVNTLRSCDTLARFGGDEFAIIQAGVENAQDGEALARRILDTLTQPFHLAHSSVTVGASIGVVIAPDHACDRETLMRLADAALYQAKSEGRNRACLFQSRMDETLRLRKIVEDDLRTAIEEDQLVLHYQPIMSGDGSTVVGVEALVRWPHPTRGLISPGDFIGLAEERGLILPLGQWVLRRACQDGKRWPGLRVSVNVSAIQFKHRLFVPGVIEIIRETGFDPARLELELTESVIVDNADAAENAMIELRAAGVFLALDDFGTGYSSLIYLRRFAFDTIKIDRSFLESMETTGESLILVHSIVHLGRALGLTVTAEGVETSEQHTVLKALGCHQLQGFLFARPMPAHDIDVFLGQRTGQLRSAAAA